jgi:hypothetical protein
VKNALVNTGCTKVEPAPVSWAGAAFRSAVMYGSLLPVAVVLEVPEAGVEEELQAARSRLADAVARARVMVTRLALFRDVDAAGGRGAEGVIGTAGVIGAWSTVGVTSVRTLKTGRPLFSGVPALLGISITADSREPE